MRILYVYFHCFDDMPYHVREWVEAAIGLGHEVVVLTSISDAFLESIGWTGKVDLRRVEYPGRGVLNHLRLSRRFAAAAGDVLDGGGFDLVYERFSTVSPAVAKAVSARGVPHCVEINGIIENELRLSGASWARRAWFVRAQRAVFAEGGSIVAVTERIKEWVVERYGVPERRVAAFPNGVNPERFKPMPKGEARRRFGVPEDKFVFGFLGSLYPWCGLDRLVEAVSAMPEEERKGLFFMVGGGQEPMKSELERLASDKGVSDIFLFSGRIPWDAAAEYISCFDVALLPADFLSLESGASPQKLFSYMACAKPVLVSSSVDLNSIVSESVGLAFDGAGSRDFADKIRFFRDMPEEKRLEMGRKGLDIVKRNFTWEKTVLKTLRWLKSVNE